MIRLAAVSDLHFTPDLAGTVRTRFEGVNDRADLLLMPGDLFNSGTPEDARLLCEELAEVRVPVVAVLGNHEYQAQQVEEVIAAYRAGGFRVLQRETITFDIRGEQVGIVGVKGGMGGFGEHLIFPSMEPEVVAWREAARLDAEAIERGLSELRTTYRVVLLHYSPARETVEGEELEEIAFYGNSVMGDAIDRLRPDIVIHGHSHHGRPSGKTPGGIPVRNVAAHVIGEPFIVVELGR
ncbi:MAG TPA: metallophosphoesterase [Chloroflexia bacterium]|nr:metallophosphoesterase [Chloroflexia bacterium]